MKMNFSTIALFMLALALVRSAEAQDRKIAKKDLPNAVSAAFEKAYPKAVIRGTSTEREGGKTYYEIESMDGGTRRDLLYLIDGSCAEIEETIDAGALPTAVKSAVETTYPKAKIEKAEKTTKESKVQYDLRIRKGKTRLSVSIDGNGAILKPEK